MTKAATRLNALAAAFPYSGSLADRQIIACKSQMLIHQIFYLAHKSFGVEIAVQDLIRAVAFDGDTIVAKERNFLFRNLVLQLSAKVLCNLHTALPFHIDQNKIVAVFPEEDHSVSMAKSRVNIEAGEAKYLLAKRTQHLATTNMQN